MNNEDDFEIEIGCSGAAWKRPIKKLSEKEILVVGKIYNVKLENGNEFEKELIAKVGEMLWFADRVDIGGDYLGIHGAKQFTRDRIKSIELTWRDK